MMTKLLAWFLTVLSIGLLSAASTASAAHWEPEGKSVAIRGTVLNVDVENEKPGEFQIFNCGEGLASSAIGTGAAAEAISFRLSYIGCNISVPTGVRWKAKAISSTQANLELPTKAAVIKVSGTCEIFLEATTLGGASDFTGGFVAALVMPLTSVVNIKEVPGKCFNKTKEQTTALFVENYQITAENGETEVKIK
jgi:hypothetical protein